VRVRERRTDRRQVVDVVAADDTGPVRLELRAALTVALLRRLLAEVARALLELLDRALVLGAFRCELLELAAGVVGERHATELGVELLLAGADLGDARLTLLSGHRNGHVACLSVVRVSPVRSVRAGSASGPRPLAWSRRSGPEVLCAASVVEGASSCSLLFGLFGPDLGRPLEHLAQAVGVALETAHEEVVGEAADAGGRALVGRERHRPELHEPRLLDGPLRQPERVVVGRLRVGPPPRGAR
jgi:hypothetical protein